MRFGGLAWGLAAPLMLAAASADADVQITTETTDTAKNETRTTTVSAAAAGVRIDLGRRVMLFQADTGKVYMLDSAAHTYMDVSAMQHAASDMMQQHLAALPEDQRKKVEAMMAAHGGAPGAAPSAAASAPANATYDKAGTKTVGSWSCTVYHQTANGRHVADLCMTPIAGVGLSEADIAPLRKLATAAAKNAPGGREDFGDRFDFDARSAAIGFDGLPVETTLFAGDQPRSHIVLKAIVHRDLPPDTFQLPAGYTPRPMMGGPPGGDQ